MNGMIRRLVCLFVVSLIGLASAPSHAQRAYVVTASFGATPNQFGSMDLNTGVSPPSGAATQPAFSELPGLPTAIWS